GPATDHAGAVHAHAHHLPGEVGKGHHRALEVATRAGCARRVLERDLVALAQRPVGRVALYHAGETDVDIDERIGGRVRDRERSRYPGEVVDGHDVGARARCRESEAVELCIREGRIEKCRVLEIVACDPVVLVRRYSLPHNRVRGNGQIVRSELTDVVV